MAIEVFVTSEEPVNPATKRLTLLMRREIDVRQTSLVIALNQDVSDVDLQAAFIAGAPVEEGVRAWKSYATQDESLFARTATAMLEQLKDGGTLAEGNTLAKITLAGRASVAENPTHIAAGNRLNALFKAATAAQQADFIVLLAVMILARRRDG